MLLLSFCFFDFKLSKKVLNSFLFHFSTVPIFCTNINRSQTTWITKHSFIWNYLVICLSHYLISYAIKTHVRCLRVIKIIFRSHVTFYHPFLIKLTFEIYLLSKITLKWNWLARTNHQWIWSIWSTSRLNWYIDRLI